MVAVKIVSIRDVGLRSSGRMPPPVHGLRTLPNELLIRYVSIQPYNLYNLLVNNNLTPDP